MKEGEELESQRHKTLARKDMKDYEVYCGTWRWNGG